MASVLGDVVAILLAAGIIAVAIGAAVAACGLWLRREWRRRRAAAFAQLHGLALGTAVAGMRWLWTRPRPDGRWRSLQRARRDLLRASVAAEHAVREAKEASAPLGDLEALCRRLRHTAIDVDRSLRIAQRADVRSDTEGLMEQARELASCGARIQQAAALSLARTHSVTSRDLVAHVRLEERAIAESLGADARPLAG